MDRISTGIEGFDEKIEGGYPAGRTILVMGETGSGKTILGLHLIYQGCLENKKCSIIATEELPEDIIAQAESLGMHLAEFYENGTLIINKIYEERTGRARDVLELGVETIDRLQSNVLGLLEHVPEGTDIVLIDNIGVLTLNMSTNEFRAQFDSLIHCLTKKKITTMVIMDLSSDEHTGGVAAYSAYGVIKTSKIDNPYTNARERFIELLKIRNTKTPLNPIRFDITSSGIVLLKNEKD